MQNRYTGDIGDFSKLGLLRGLSNAGFSIGLNWYLTPNETHNEDGKHTEYLCQAEQYRFLDSQLFDELKDIIDSGSREVSAMEKTEILEAKFFSEILDFPTSSKIRGVRDGWHSRALHKLKGKDIVCLDPDNGLIVPSATGTRRENKYVLREELHDYYQQGSSVIYYQHKARRKDEYYREQFAALEHECDRGTVLLSHYSSWEGCWDGSSSFRNRTRPKNKPGCITFSSVIQPVFCIPKELWKSLIFYSSILIRLKGPKRHCLCFRSGD